MIEPKPIALTPWTSEAVVVVTVVDCARARGASARRGSKVSGAKECRSCPAGNREERALANLSIVPDGSGCGARRTLLDDPGVHRCPRDSQCWALVVDIHLRCRVQMSVEPAGAPVKSSCAFDQRTSAF